MPAEVATVPLFTQNQEEDSACTSSIAALAVVFKNEATLCQCSGIKFFNDPLGINTV